MCNQMFLSGSDISTLYRSKIRDLSNQLISKFFQVPFDKRTYFLCGIRRLLLRFFFFETRNVDFNISVVINFTFCILFANSKMNSFNKNLLIPI